MKVIITGANSFIGARMCWRFAKAGWQVTAVMRNTYDFGENVEQILLDMENYDRLGKLTGGADCMLHLAWNGTRGAARMDRKKQRDNVEYSMNAVRSMLAAGCKRVVTAGSQAEYGPHADQISELTKCMPNTEYGKAKLLFYNEAAALCEALGATCIEPRFFSLYGQGDEPSTMIITTLEKMLHDEPCPLTKGVQMWDYLHVEDACDALLALCVNTNIKSGVYNFGSGDTRPLGEYIREMARITQSNSLLQFGLVSYPETGMVSLWPDVSKLKQTLGWEPRISFAEGIRSIITSLERNK